ncbi:CdiA C-terminal domain-containing protein [Saccharothrix deserti]|uniref:CdiA C-terminal domain-containing protein n=1 Tax=Saccharothrix deserti TaxID=2593674 RepID=UPI00131ACDF3|nr:hypothetical protein [Saccharothrix deserti]
MDGLGLAWSGAGDVFVDHGGQSGEEPPKSAWGDQGGDELRLRTAQQRGSTLRTGQRMQRLGRLSSAFGSDIRYTKEAIKEHVESLEPLYLLNSAFQRDVGGIAVPTPLDAFVDSVATSVDQFITTMADRIAARGDDERGKPRAEFPDTAPGYTPPSRQPDPDARPHGTPTVSDPKASAERQRSDNRENESAEVLAKQGFDVEQNPAVKPNGKAPDYLIEGKYFDNYAPGAASERGIHDNIQKKVASGQVDRVVVNFGDSHVDPQVVRDNLHNYEVEGLKEVVGIDKNKNLVRLYP